MIEEDENEGLQIVCPHCGKPVLIPAGYSRPVFLCPRCHRSIPLTEQMLEMLKA